MKKLLLTAALLVLGLLWCGAAQAETYKDITEKWMVDPYRNDDGSVSWAVTAYLGDATNVVIPSSLTAVIDGTDVTRPVTCLADTFWGDANLQKVTVNNDYVTKILFRTFKNCTSLTELILGSTVTTIESSVFEGVDLSKLNIDYFGSLEEYQSRFSSLMPGTIDNLSITTDNGKNWTVYAGITIRYIYEDGSQAAPSHTELLDPRGSFSIVSPKITGFTADQRIVSGSLAGHSDTYTVAYTRNKYTIQFVKRDYHGVRVLQTLTVPHGDTPAYTGSTPTMQDEATVTYTFTGWDPPIAPATGDATYTAQFESKPRKYNVNVEAAPAEGGTVSGGGGIEYGTEATVTATPADDYRFVKWTERGTTVSTSATYSFRVTTDRLLMAHFEPVYDGGGTQADPWVVNRDHSDIVWKSGWYKVPSDYTLSSRVTVTGDVHLILGESATLTAMKGINVAGDRSLTVSGTGALNVGADQHNAAIGGNSGQSAGTIVIDGGVLTVNAGNFASGIGGGNQGGAGYITINGSTVNRQFAGSSSGIGTGKEGRGGSVTINGGSVNAQGRFGAGIGGGDQAPGIAVSITGGTVVAQNYNGGAGIGGGPYRNGGSVTISGGHVTAIGSVYPDTGQGAPGIGSGRPQTSGSTQLNGGTCEITGGTVIAIAGNTNEGNGAQAIGANYQDNPGTLTLGAGMKASTSESAAAVCPKDRKPACRGGWVKVEPCGHSFYGGVCAWCGAQNGNAAFGPATFTLPASTESIGANAFENAKMTAVDAKNCASIGAEAFKGCAGLIQVRLPKDCQIDGTAFDGCTALIAVYAPAGGTTQTWAESLDIPFVAFPAGQ